jgi:23S rRNA (cytosine1962-C5)-methyltransferase
MMLPTLILKNQKPYRRFHPWIFAGEVAQDPGVEPGTLVEIHDHNRKFRGVGFYNPHSQIRVRFLTREHQTIDRGWWYDRLERALVYRQRFVGDTNAFRWVHGEADGLPGLTVDRYGDYLVVQFLAMGLEPWREAILDTLMQLGAPRGIYERSDAPVRALEGLKETAGLLRGEMPPALIEIQEGPARLLVDVVHGQKTGFFLDQRDNRAMVGRFAKGREVLNCFAYTGGFSVHAGAGGAKSVISVEISEPAAELCDQNAALNRVSNHLTITENAFDLLREFNRERRSFDMVILDPPAFAKSRGALEGAIKGYKEINLRALRLLAPGGILVTCSCSAPVDLRTFRETLAHAAQDAGKTVRILEERGASADHAPLLGVPETEYLKCVVATVM